MKLYDDRKMLSGQRVLTAIYNTKSESPVEEVCLSYSQNIPFAVGLVYYFSLTLFLYFYFCTSAVCHSFLLLFWAFLCFMKPLLSFKLTVNLTVFSKLRASFFWQYERNQRLNLVNDGVSTSPTSWPIR